MSQTIAKPPAANPLRGSRARGWGDPETRSTMIGIVGVILIHLLLWLLAPHMLTFEHTGEMRPHAAAKEFNIEIDPEMLAKPEDKPKDPFRFVETNPEAPENIPDKTENFAAQNQQAAQETPNPDGTSDRAATEGKKDFESNQIVSGSLTQPIEPLPAPPPGPRRNPPAGSAAFPSARPAPRGGAPDT